MTLLCDRCGDVIPPEKATWAVSDVLCPSCAWIGRIAKVKRASDLLAWLRHQPEGRSRNFWINRLEKNLNRREEYEKRKRQEMKRIQKLMDY